MRKTSEIYLGHILESIALIDRRMKDITHERFMSDVDLQDMVVRRLEIIGEAVRNLPKDYRSRHADINWDDPAGMRSALIHAYFEVDFDIVWDTIATDLPLFKKQIQKLLEQ